MNSEISQTETSWGFFDRPIIKIDENFSKFENLILEAKDGGLMDMESTCGSMYENLKMPDLKKRKEVKLRKYKTSDENINTVINAKRRWDLMLDGKPDMNGCEFGQLEKKVKKDSSSTMTSGAYQIGETVQSDFSTVETNSPIQTDFDQNKDSASVSIKPESSNKSQTPLEGRKRATSKESQIIEVLMNHEIEKLVFKIESDKELVNMTREDILEQDPTLLVYFYEKNLQFKKSNSFSAEGLKKL